MAMLNYEAEIRPADQIMALPQPRRVSRQVRLAQTLIRAGADDEFDFSRYEDRYREKVQALIDAKIQGREIAVPAPEEAAPQVVNLMEALKKSVAQTASGTSGKRRGKKRRSA
jgi:DNA end-binding protein Ku